MNQLPFLLRCFLTMGFLFSFPTAHAQQPTADSLAQENQSGTQFLQAWSAQRKADSLQRVALEQRLAQLERGDEGSEEMEAELEALRNAEAQRIAKKLRLIDSLRASTPGSAVLSPDGDTLFSIYARLGSATPAERAYFIQEKISRLFDNDFFNPDSMRVVEAEGTVDLVYKDLIIATVTEVDGLWNGLPPRETADHYRASIAKAHSSYVGEHALIKLLIRIGLIGLIILVLAGILWAIGRVHTLLRKFVMGKKDVWFHDLSYRNYTFLTGYQQINLTHHLLRILKWLLIALALYIALPIAFSVFPFSRHWADALFGLVYAPFKKLFLAIWHYLPNLLSIFAIYLVMRYVIRAVHYIFKEIEAGKLQLSGFHEDWAKPTYGIVRFLLYAFMFVMIFPYLPGSDSNIFKGVSVFIGVLFSLGSSSAIANMVAGLVITYMRPFKLDDIIKIGDVTGRVVEKTLLVTRIRTPKNEVITIPNASVLTGNTTNYSSEAKEGAGLVLHTTVTIGYDVPWRKMHEALIQAAEQTPDILKDPKPFVLQTSLDDFYVSYQLNAYTRAPERRPMIYSALHQNIQDICARGGIEIMSPHYRAARDGNMVTIPAEYLPENYVAPSFRVQPPANPPKP